MRHAFVVKAPTYEALRALNYTPEVESFRAQSGMRAVALDAILSSMGPAYGAVFTRLDCDRETGVELITQSDMFAAEPSGRVIRMDSMARPERHKVRRWQVLIAAAGTLGENELYGRAIIADGRIVNRYVGPHAMVLTFEDEGGPLNLYAYAFLCSKIGIKAIRSASFGTKILGVRKDILGKLPIPLADDATISRVAELVRETVEQRERYATNLEAARKVITDLSEMREAHAMCAERRARCIAWSGELPTMRAWNYASAGEALAFLRSRWSGSLRDILTTNGIEKGGRFARIEVEAPHGCDLLSQRDVFMMRPVCRRIAVPSIYEELRVENADVFVASRGQLVEGALFGSCELGANLPRGAIVSEDFVRLHTTTGMAAALLAVLTTPVGRSLVKTTAYGTSIPGMRLDLFKKLPFPTLSDEQLALVRRFVAGAVAARHRAIASESEAIRIIEEEVLPQWLA